MFLWTTAVQAQDEATAVKFLSVELWPDYDQPAVLVLLTGTLPDDVVLPATVVLPLPAAARLNAVARIDSSDVMNDDINYQQRADSLTLTTPDSRFRVEYYVPYTIEGNGRSYTFQWQSPLLVAQTAVTVQQPAAADRITIEPTAVNTTTHNDNLTYHDLSSTTIPPNTPYAVQINYTMPTPRLTVEAASSPAAAAVETTTPTFPNTYFLLAGASAVFVILYVGYHYGRRLQNQPKRKPKPSRQSKTRQKFCHNCGTPVQPSDVFCHQCGTSLKK
ncbi:MAG: zinc ribbon domain-containing protein [Anaerolineales bacterium]|nr:zinc ribbon domain-containing protein [Anaerolineales bacterium]